MKKIVLPILALLGVLMFAVTAFAQGPITVKNQDIIFDFPQNMTFTLDATSSSDIQEMTLVARFADVTRRVPAKITPAKEVKAQIEWNLDTENSTADGGYLPPGVTANYTWLVKDAAGNEFETQPQEFVVVDNRLPWQTVESDDLAIHWYGTGDSFGQNIFDAGVETLAKVRQELGAGAGGKVHVWFYTNRDDFQSSMPDMNVWTGGRSFGNYRVIILLNEQPVDVQEAIRGTRHELTHQVIFDSLGGGLARTAFPHWLNEGLATYNESGDNSLMGYFQGPLERAIRSDTLPTLKSREANFPPDPEQALVSYAFSYSIVDMLFKEFGQAKVQEMYRSFQKGIPSDETFTAVFGMDTNGLDNMYRKSVGLAERNYASNGLPTPKAIPTFALSSAGTSVPETRPTATTQSVAVANTPATGAATAVPQSSNTTNSGSGSTGLCGGVLGGFVLAMFGAYGWRKRRKLMSL